MYIRTRQAIIYTSQCPPPGTVGVVPHTNSNQSTDKANRSERRLAGTPDRKLDCSRLRWQTTWLRKFHQPQHRHAAMLQQASQSEMVNRYKIPKPCSVRMPHPPGNLARKCVSLNHAECGSESKRFWSVSVSHFVPIGYIRDGLHNIWGEGMESSLDGVANRDESQPMHRNCRDDGSCRLPLFGLLTGASNIPTISQPTTDGSVHPRLSISTQHDNEDETPLVSTPLDVTPFLSPPAPLAECC